MQKKILESLAHKRIPIRIKDPIPDTTFDMKKVIDYLEYIPASLFRQIKLIHIGKFDEFKERQINAMYHDGVIYISNFQENEEDMIVDIIHEIAHSLEEQFRIPDEVKEEFIQKRLQLASRIYNADGKIIPDYRMKNLEYDEELDMYLLDYGYPRIEYMSYDLMPSAYCFTSLSEYFACGLEYYFTQEGNKQFIKQYCPELNRFIESLVEYLT